MSNIPNEQLSDDAEDPVLGSRPEQFKCQFCSKSYRHRSSLSRHKSTYHRTSRTIQMKQTPKFRSEKSEDSAILVGTLPSDQVAIPQQMLPTAMPLMMQSMPRNMQQMHMYPPPLFYPASMQYPQFPMMMLSGGMQGWPGQMHPGQMQAMHAIHAGGQMHPANGVQPISARDAGAIHDLNVQQ